MLSTEDWWAVWMGLGFFLLGLLSIKGLDLVGWIAYPSKWVFSLPEGAVATKIVTIDKAFYALGAKHSLVSKEFYAGLGLFGSLIFTYGVFTIATTIGAYFMKWNIKKYLGGWTIIFGLTYLVWFIGHHAFFAATAIDLKKSNFPDMLTLSLGGGASLIMALIVGLIIGNFFKGFSRYLSEAAKPEWFIKTAIVYLGVKVGYLPIKAAVQSEKLGKAVSGLTFELFIAGAAATVVAYLIFWPGI